MNFSVPEIADLQARYHDDRRLRRLLHRRVHAGRPRREPRVVKAGVVGGSYLRRDGPAAGARPSAQRARTMARTPARAAVLTYRFWTTALKRDPAVVGKTIRLGPRNATVVGVLEPSVPYPADTEIIANIVDQPASPRRDDGHQPHPPHDRAVRPAGARRDGRGGACRTDRDARRDDAASIPRRTRRRPMYS